MKILPVVVLIGILYFYHYVNMYQKPHHVYHYQQIPSTCDKLISYFQSEKYFIEEYSYIMETLQLYKYRNKIIKHIM